METYVVFDKRKGKLYSTHRTLFKDHIMNYRNAKYINEHNRVLDCEIEHPRFGWIPYTLDPADTEASINHDELLASMKIKNDIAAYIPPTQEELDIEAAFWARQVRDGLLLQIDAIAGNPLRWAALSADQQTAWGVCRTQLLDVPQQPGFPNQIVWPVKPE